MGIDCNEIIALQKQVLFVIISLKEGEIRGTNDSGLPHIGAGTEYGNGEA